jgi:aspartyl-tRNA(Asn)/glutamyl-tRNA(Gln) amidotransferase subunit A
VRGLVLAKLPAHEREGVAAEVLAAYDEAVAVLGALGAEIVTPVLPCRFVDTAALTGRIIGAESYSLMHEIVDDLSLDIDSAVRPRIRSGHDISSRDYLGALAEREALKRAYGEALAGIDALLTPTTSTAAIPLEAVDQSRTPAHFTRFVNILDLCALAIPDGFTTSGLPISLQIICPAYDEAMALRIGWAYQQETDWHDRRPPGLARPAPSVTPPAVVTPPTGP